MLVPIDSGVRRRPVANLAACLAHRHTTAMLREVPAPFGLNHPDSVSNLMRRAQKHLAQSRQDRNLAARIFEPAIQTENTV